MAEEQAAIDISDMPELLRIVEEVRLTRRPRVLQRDNEDMALVVPMPTKGRRGRRRTDDRDAVLAAAGGWKDLVDAEALKAQLAEERGSDRRPASL